MSFPGRWLPKETAGEWVGKGPPGNCKAESLSSAPARSVGGADTVEQLQNRAQGAAPRSLGKRGGPTPKTHGRGGSPWGGEGDPDPHQSLYALPLPQMFVAGRCSPRHRGASPATLHPQPGRLRGFCPPRRFPLLLPLNLRYY